MTGPEHYAEAGYLAGPYGEWYRTDVNKLPALLARAQVHATLALAAATALAAKAGISATPAEMRQWDEVTAPSTQGAKT
jgi:hypothetical protein